MCKTDSSPSIRNIYAESMSITKERDCNENLEFIRVHFVCTPENAFENHLF